MAVTVRKAKLEDRIAIFEWFNDLYTQAMFDKKTTVNKDIHKKWFDSVLSSESEFLLIPYYYALRIGVIRFSKRDKYWEMTLYIKMPYMMQSLCYEVIQSSINYVKSFTKIKKIMISIEKGNEMIPNIFNNAGFEFVENQNDRLIFIKGL